ncbi:MAG: hypothetical protein Q8912_06840 [Bacillota bacterium]|nr:hypothetical protein [Bacillota bacterium]MDP4160331.1 hypothetical protein [Bacillota bacterium]
MTHRSMLTTQSKLTVQAPALGSGVPAKSAIRRPWMAKCPCSHGRREGTLAHRRQCTSDDHGWSSVTGAKDGGR